MRRPQQEGQKPRPLLDYESDRELAALTSPRVRAALAQGGIEPISYRDLANLEPP